MRLDLYDTFPSGMRKYLSYYGWHFNKAMYEWAISNMSSKNTNLHKLTKEEVDNILIKHNVTIENKTSYDYVYVANMATFDYLNSSIADEKHLALFIKDYVDDVDGYPELPFTRFYADCIGKGIPINWSDML